MPEPNAPALPAPWGVHPIPEDEALTLELGPLTLWARHRAGEVWLAHAPGDWTRTGRQRAAEPPSEPEDEDWVRWPVPEATRALALSPAFPDRPVVAEPELSFRLLPRARARIFVRVPLWVRVGVRGDAERTLAELPSVVLSDTWWGTPTEGELCYWLHTTARRSVPDEVLRPHVAACPLQLVNRSDDELPVEKISLRVAHLSLFLHEGHLWADETRVQYRGAEEGSDVQVLGERPSEAPGATRVAPPQEAPPARGFRARSFARLKALPGLAGL